MFRNFFPSKISPTRKVLWADVAVQLFIWSIAPMDYYQAKSKTPSTTSLSSTSTSTPTSTISTSSLSLMLLLNIKLSIKSIWQPGVWTVPTTKCCLKVTTRRQCRHLCWYCNYGTMPSVNPSTRNVLFHIIGVIVCDGKLNHIALTRNVLFHIIGVIVSQLCDMMEPAFFNFVYGPNYYQQLSWDQQQLFEVRCDHNAAIIVRPISILPRDTDSFSLKSSTGINSYSSRLQIFLVRIRVRSHYTPQENAN